MEAQALITSGDQSFSIETVILPELQKDQIAVKTRFSGVSIGTEFALIRGKLSWGPYPLCTGYQGTGIVEAVGEDVADFQAGQPVYFRCCNGMSLRDGTKVSAVSGTHASHVVLKPDTAHGADLLPAGVDMATASLFVMPAVGLYGADMAQPRMGQTVVVFGCGLIGLGALASCVHRGCVVAAVDLQTRPLETAKAFGADHLIDASKENVSERIGSLFPGGADVVFECTGIPAMVNQAIPLCRLEGTFVWQGNYGQDPISFDFLPAHGRRLKMVFPCDDGFQPCRRAVLRNMALGALPWEKTITHRVPWREAPGIYRRILQGDSDISGVVLDWTE